ncbi:MAG: GFA family protein [Pseudorhodobacter sp.]
MKGSCLCGKVRYRITGQARSIVACHCTQCRKTSGHHVAATQVKRESLEITGSENLNWYRSSETAKRAFCNTCGSQLFWTRCDSADISIMAGTLDNPTGLRMDRQICTESKGDYYPLPNVTIVDQSTL